MRDRVRFATVDLYVVCNTWTLNVLRHRRVSVSPHWGRFSIHISIRQTNYSPSICVILGFLTVCWSSPCFNSNKLHLRMSEFWTNGSLWFILLLVRRYARRKWWVLVRMIVFISTLATISLNHIQYIAIADLHTLYFIVTNTLVLSTIYSFSAVSSWILAREIITLPLPAG
jgi:hypothetical protein